MLKKIKQIIGAILALPQLYSCKRGKGARVKGFLILKNRGTITLGDNVVFHSTVQRSFLSVHKDGILKIGDNSFINFGANISVLKEVNIGNNVQIGPYCLIYDSDFHNIPGKTCQSAAVTVKDDVWIASRCTILKGVTIGKGSVVCTGAVVTKDVPAGVVVGGIPAKIISHNKENHNE